LLPISDFTIKLNSSKDYFKLAILLHLFALIVLFNSSFPLLLLIAGIVTLIFSITNIYICKTPLPKYIKLTYQERHWLIYKKNCEPIKYESATISFNGGIFIILNLTGISKSKKIVIFIDQLTKEQLRKLRLIDLNKPVINKKKFSK